MAIPAKVKLRKCDESRTRRKTPLLCTYSYMSLMR
jgi:hypothetical protein